MGIHRNHLKGSTPIMIGPVMRQRVVWFLVIIGILSTHWIFYDLLMGWFFRIQSFYSRVTDLHQIGWHTVTLLIWVLAAVSFMRGKIDLGGK